MIKISKPGHSVEIFTKRRLIFDANILSNYECYRIEDNKVKLLMEEIDKVPGVVEWYIRRYSIFIIKAESYQWGEMLPEIKSLINNILEEIIGE